MTPTNDNSPAVAPTPPLPFTFGGLTVPAGCRRIFITAELEPSNGDPRIQPTGFPDLGPVLYADPAERDGLICLIESEASMANRLEEICLKNKYEGNLRDELSGLPYIRLTTDGTANGEFVTASTIDGHRFASEYIMGAHVVEGPELQRLQNAVATTTVDTAKAAGTNKGGKTKAKSAAAPEFVHVVRQYMGMVSKDRCPAANVPRIFQVAMDYDPMALLHGFQISVKDKLTFVGLRSPRAITASIVGLNCQRITVPGVRFDPIGTGDAGQAIFQKPRISAQRIEVRFSIDVGLLGSLGLGSSSSNARLRLLLAISLCKIAWFLGILNDGLRLRTDCDLRVVSGTTRLWSGRPDGPGEIFDFAAVGGSRTDLSKLVAECHFSQGHSPFFLKHVPKAKAEKQEKETDGQDASDDSAESDQSADDE